MSLTLRGVTVLDLSRVLAGPYCTMAELRLADMPALTCIRAHIRTAADRGEGQS